VERHARDPTICGQETFFHIVHAPSSHLQLIQNTHSGISTCTFVLLYQYSTPAASLSVCLSLSNTETFFRSLYAECVMAYLIKPQASVVVLL
jgi:hypothetical protein